MWHVKISVVVLAGVKVSKISGLDVPQYKSKRYVNLKTSRLSFKNLPGYLLELVNVEIMQCVIKTVLYSIIHVFPSPDGIPVLQIHFAGVRVFW